LYYEILLGWGILGGGSGWGTWHVMSEKTRRGLWLNRRERGYMEDVGMDGRIILRWIMKK
jgi:hypothetical protein